MEIARCLVEEEYSVTKVGVAKFLCRYKETGSISCQPGMGRASKVTASICDTIEKPMEKDGETSGSDLKAEGVEVSVSSVLRWRKDLGRTSKGTSYCQMICDANKKRRLQFAHETKEMTFDDIIYTDETTVQIETHRRMCSYKKDCKPHYKLKPKHSLKVHVWVGIGQCGKAGLCIFEGEKNAPLFISILRSSLLPFIKDVYTDGHCFVQDNDPKHCSKNARNFYHQEGINWWTTPPKSPGPNPNAICLSSMILDSEPLFQWS